MNSGQDTGRGSASEKRRLAAIVAADVVGYSRLMNADEVGTLARLRMLINSIIRPTLVQNSGRIVKEIGDGLLLEFASSVDAVRFALSMQQLVTSAEDREPPESRISYRIGIHLGEVIVDGDDIFGDAVNVASRLEAVASAGQICVSAIVKEQLGNRVQVKFNDWGRQTLKNIPDSIHVFGLSHDPSGDEKSKKRSYLEILPHSKAYRRLAAAGAVFMLSMIAAVFILRSHMYEVSTAGTANPDVWATPDKPSIAVLPFQNIGDDPQESYFADGFTEDLITDLAKVSGLFVIARNSTFAYRDARRNIRDIARNLAVRYVLEGSVRRSVDDIRVNAQLVDAISGAQVWAERYDGTMSKVFAMQDRVAQSVVEALSVRLTGSELERVTSRGTENPEAFDTFLRGWQRYLRQTPEDYRAAIQHFERAVELDKSFGRGYAALALIYWDIYRRYWSERVGLGRNAAAVVKAEEFLGLALKYPTALAHQVASSILLLRHQHVDALEEARSAVASEPSDADSYVALAGVLNFMGKCDEALSQIERAMGLNPHYPPGYLYQRGLAQFCKQDYESAAATLEAVVTASADNHWAERLLLSAYGLLGRSESASKVIRALRDNENRGMFAFQDPLNVRAIAFWFPFAVPDLERRFTEGLRKAGLPD